MTLFKIIAFVFLIPGISTVFLARTLVEKYNLDRSIKCDPEMELDEDGQKQYRYHKAVVNLKMLGLLVALPGFIILFVAFR